MSWTMVYPQIRSVVLGSQVLLIVLALLVASIAAVGFTSYELPVESLLVVPVLLVPFVVLNRPGIGLAVLPAVAVLVPFSIGTGTQSPIVAALMFTALLLGVWFARALLARDFSIANSQLNAPMLVFMLVWILAYLYSLMARDPLVDAWPTFPLAQFGGLAVVLISACLCLLALNIGRERRWIALTVWVFLGLGALALVAFVVGPQNLKFLETGGLFTMWVVALSFGQALFNRELPMWLRITLGLMALIWEAKAAGLQTWWFSGWLPSGIALLVILFFRSRRAFSLSLLVGGALAALKYDVVYEAVWGTTVKKGDLTRLDIWAQTFDLVGKHPLLGTGPAGYAAYFMTFYRDTGFSLSTHNNYLDVIAQTGIAGSIIFIWLMLTFVVLGWIARLRWQSGFLGGYAQGAFGGLLGLLVAMSQGDWFTPFVYNQTIAGFRYTVHSWIFLGFLASLALAPAVRRITTQAATR